MAITAEQIDEAIARALLAKKKRVSVDGLSSETESLSLEELLRLKADTAAATSAASNRSPVRYQTMVPIQRGY